MERDTLEEILAVEREIRATLESERDAAGRWIASARRDVEEHRLAEVARLEESTAQQEAAAQEAARMRAAEIIRQATRAAERIGRMTDEELVRFILPHLARIVPGGPA